MSNKPLVPRDWKTLNAISDAGKQNLIIKPTMRGKEVPAFNGSQTSRRAKKRPITLPKIDWPKPC